MRLADAQHPVTNAGSRLDFPAPEELLHFFRSIDLTGRSALVAAVSGGSDSVALLMLARAWLKTAAPEVRLIAVTVDHGLRPGSAHEAQTVRELCARHGIVHQVQHWHGDKPSTGIAAAARDARYGLLAQSARTAGTDIVLAGHTLDDQVETISMRGTRGDGRGLAGMASATLYDQTVWIVRPLLQVRRTALRSWLTEAGIGWVDDPTNSDVRYERPRMRLALNESAAPIPVEAAQRARISLGKRAAWLISHHAQQVAPGLICLEPDFLSHSDADAGTYALRIMLAAVGGVEHLPEEARSGALHHKLRTGAARATLSRCVVERRRGGVFLRRELRGLPAAAPVVHGAVWDGRFIVDANHASTDLRVAPMGEGAPIAHQRHDCSIAQSLVRASLAAQPAFFINDILAGPTVDAGKARALARFSPMLTPWARFLPAFDLAPARSLARLLGHPVPPSSPFTGHIEG
ncbi:tRNA lysidine(34) synthetase TilS [Mesorhizobium sp. NBSH29]|uniref:tRNA lysidine(34) synthetase TilS n=1 Tax=Mesorhizobium sp. NBSH29 TaxID=2654249 RepID=UPI0021563A5A|nr:tRNA lysidine(34) synthetase TilS [Mesorhizobium sp. NBSH29]